MTPKHGVGHHVASTPGDRIANYVQAVLAFSGAEAHITGHSSSRALVVCLIERL